MLSAYLLYKDREFGKADSYQDSSGMVTDLGLKQLFENAAISKEARDRKSAQGAEQDEDIRRAMQRVMMTPLETAEEIEYRQSVLKDFLGNPEFAERFYGITRELMEQWRKLGKKEREKGGNTNTSRTLLFEVRLMNLFLDALTDLKRLCRGYSKSFHSEGLQRFCDMLTQNYHDEWEEKVRLIMMDLRFFSNDEEVDVKHYYNKTTQGSILMECAPGSGLKLGQMKLEQIGTREVNIGRHTASKTMLDRVKVVLSKEPMTIITDEQTLDNLEQLKIASVGRVFDYMQGFSLNCKKFFEMLLVQSAFYMGCMNLYERCRQIGLPICYPTVCKPEDMEFTNLMELSMALYNRRVPVGNDCEFKDKRLLVVTGANQGGKSTFLRSIGIAQVMLQSGMFVAAKRFSSGIFTHLFTHFVRREDMAMNSGRLDEELGRIHRIVEGLQPESMVLLNESFATTTEEEGSEIAYDIIKAFTEAGVKVLTVTHLLTFAKKVYAEEWEKAVFLSAQRLEDGTRTYKMVAGEPELTSFGLDLYEQVISVKE